MEDPTDVFLGWNLYAWIMFEKENGGENGKILRKFPWRSDEATDLYIIHRS